MAQHKLNPVEGETWFHPTTFNVYRIHSLGTDGWVRYQAVTPSDTLLPMITTMPTLDFVRIYKKMTPKPDPDQDKYHDSHTHTLNFTDGIKTGEHHG